MALFIISAYLPYVMMVSGIRALQCILLKIALLVGVEVHRNVTFEGLKEPAVDPQESQSIK